MGMHNSPVQLAFSRIARACRDRRLHTGVALGIAAGIVAVWTVSTLRDPSRASRPFRIGFQQAAPLQYVNNGKPAGPAIEIVAEAARRRHIPLEWVLSPDGPEPNLKAGKVDLWPLLGDLAERRQFLYISDPWMSKSFWLATLESSGISSPNDTAGHSLWHNDISITNRMAKANFPEARLVPQRSNAAAMEGVCLGNADAALIAGSTADAAGLAEISACQKAHVKVYPLPNGIVNFGLGASFKRPDAGRAADAIREEIGEMSRDGTVSAIYFRWFQSPGNDSTNIYYLTDAQRRSRYLVIVVGALTVLLGLFAWQSSRVVIARRTADRLNIELKQASHELAAANIELKEASLTDPLTKLHNRRFFLATIGKEINKSLRQYSERPTGEPAPKGFLNRDIVFYLVDIDHFKSVNDLYGHPKGDAMLVEAARRIGSAIRNSDMLVRWGGEEFLVVSYPTERTEAETLAIRIMREFSEQPFDLGDSVQIRKTCSIGWAPFPWFVAEPNALPYDDVLSLADRALYMAKHSGRNCAMGLVPSGADPVYLPSNGDAQPAQVSKSDRVPVQVRCVEGPVVEDAPAETRPLVSARSTKGTRSETKAVTQDNRTDRLEVAGVDGSSQAAQIYSATSLTAQPANSSRQDHRS